MGSFNILISYRNKDHHCMNYTSIAPDFLQLLGFTLAAATIFIHMGVSGQVKEEYQEGVFKFALASLPFLILCAVLVVVFMTLKQHDNIFRASVAAYFLGLVLITVPTLWMLYRMIKGRK